ncbi:glutathione S-transferase C-terminal domain-containing protein [Ruegeria sp. 2012CJ41-6]|uniref:Glutathione S-transferase C-terminal domain-containing protein n=2 Tax=Ruegeria spongiae TaxID=2942209 RepID=A0ABT0Q510_9RHOB|nr:glutathione S-transferase C-terminal domain-containing protein [Ruegeria spongiae]
MALAHKGLSFEPQPWRITEKHRIAASGGITAPVLVDGRRWLRDSWKIALYLEETYPAHPLMAGPAALSRCRFLNSWADGTLHPALFRAVIAEQFPLTAEIDKAYYLERTLMKFGQSVEQIGADPDPAAALVSNALVPVEDALSLAPYLGGDAPDYGDYILFGTFQWARVVSRRHFWPQGSALERWFDALLDAFDGMGRAQPPRAHWDLPPLTCLAR